MYALRVRFEYVFLVGKLEGKSLLERPRRRWVNVRVDLKRLDEEELAGLIWLKIGTGGGRS